MGKLKAEESDGWDAVMKEPKEGMCCPGDDWADGYNKGVKDSISELEKSDE